MKNFLLNISLLALLFAFSGAGFAFAQTGDQPGGSEVFKRENQAVEWKLQVPGVDYSADKDMSLKPGEIVAARENSILLRLPDGSSLSMMPFSVVRIQVETDTGKAALVPELLFGEALLRGNGVVLMPGQKIEGAGVVYFVVDEEKYSMAAVAEGKASILPVGATATLALSAGSFLELGPTGETGETTQMLPEDIELYTKMSPRQDSPKASVPPDEKSAQLDPITEVWTRDRIAFLREGAETPAGLAIARGETTKANQPVETQENITVFDKTKSPEKKSLTFSTTVTSDKKDSDAPKLTSVLIGRKQATIGEVLSLKFKDLDGKTIIVAGKASVADLEQWRLFIKVNGDETKIDTITNFEQTIRVSQDFPALPKVFNVTVGEQRAESLIEGSVLTRENLTSGKMSIAGLAEAGRNIINYTIEFVARNADDKEFPVGTFKVELDLSEIARVEASTDGGSSWETAKGNSDFTYGFTPFNGEKYRVKVRAWDVMDNRTEEQMEPYEFIYLYKTDAEQVREIFDTLMRAYLDKDRPTFFRSVAQDFRCNLDDMRDYNELYSSVQERFACCSANIRYTIREVDANRSTSRGTVDFNWMDRSGIATENNSAFFTFTLEENEWKLQEVVDPNTFLRASRNPYRIELAIDRDHLNADGESIATVRAHVLDNAGSIVADNVYVDFSATSGSFSPPSSPTRSGYADTTYTASTTPGTVTITAVSGSVQESINIVLDPVAPPGPPGN